MYSVATHSSRIRLPRPARHRIDRATRRAGLMATAELVWRGWVDRRRAALETTALALIARRAVRRGAKTADRNCATLQRQARAASARALGPRGSWSALADLLEVLGAAARRAGAEFATDPDVLAAAGAAMRERAAQISGRKRRAAALSLAACGIALSGASAHVLSRDADRARELNSRFAEFYRALGLTAASVDGTMDFAARQTAYRRDVVHAEPYQVALDYLRDKQSDPTRESKTRRFAAVLTDAGSYCDRFLVGAPDFGLIEDAEELLTDLAMLPVNLYEDNELFDERRAACDAIAFARRLFTGVDFQRNPDTGAAALTEAGLCRAERLAPQYGPFWSGEARRALILTAALDSLHMFRRDVDYVIAGKGILPISPALTAIIDSGAAPVRLRTMLAAKEGVISTHDGAIADTISLGRFIARYSRRGAVMMRDSAVTGEFWRAYRLTSVRLNRAADATPSPIATSVFETDGEKWRVVADRAACLAGSGAPTLIVVATTTGAEAVSRELARARAIAARLDNGRGDANRTATLATGSSEVRDWLKAADLDGRHDAVRVLLTEAQLGARDERRLRSLLARTARRPKVEEYLSWDDPALAVMKNRLWVSLARRWRSRSRRIAHFAIARAQMRTDALQSNLREAQNMRDQLYQRVAAFSYDGKLGSDW